MILYVLNFFNLKQGQMKRINIWMEWMDKWLDGWLNVWMAV